MDNFDYDAPAEVYAGRSYGARRGGMTYKRFDTAAEAIRFAIEGQDEKRLAATVIESGDQRLATADIKALYESAAYPLERSARAALPAAAAPVDPQS